MKQLVLMVFAVVTCAMVNAQSWQWGKRGGGTNQLSGGSNGDDETVLDMATDKNANVYVLASLVSGPPVSVGNTLVTTYEDSFHFHNTNLLIASFNCSGALRWSKVIGGSSGVVGSALRVDTAGHVFVMGRTGFVQNLYGQMPIHFSTDTTLPFNLFKSLFIVQYDTSGTYKWLRMPQADTITDFQAAGRARGFDMELDNSGNANAIAYMQAGALSGSNLTIPNDGVYVLKYNPQGILLSASGTPIHIKGYATQSSNYATGIGAKLACMKSGKWVFAGNVTGEPLVFNTDSVKGSGFAACFDAQWNLLWRKMNDSLGGQFVGLYGRPVTDAADNIYLGGGTYPHTMIFGDSMMTNNLAIGGVPFVVKINGSGRALWLNNASDNVTSTQPFVHAGSGIVGMALRSDGALFTTGSCGGLHWGSFHVPSMGNSGYDVFIGRHDTATGNILQLDTLAKYPGNQEYSSAIASNKKGDIYIGGQMDGALYVGHDTLLSAGGISDFFVGKYGYACCVTVPTSNFTSTLTASKTIQFTYTGTTTPIDSLVWNFGDGQKQKVTTGYTTPISHTYAANGHYSASATVYSSCGSGTYSKGYALSVGSISALDGVKVYPNPTLDYLTIEDAEGATAMLMNSVGQQIMSITLSSGKQSVNTSGLSSGIYILTLQDKNGNKGTIRITKQ